MRLEDFEYDWFPELVDQLLEMNPELDVLASSHSLGFTSALDALPDEVVSLVQDAIRRELGDVVELYHGTEEELPADLCWRRNSSFTSEFDLEFAGEDGYIVVAQVPIERIRFYLHGEREFVVSEGRLDCEVYTVREYFSL